MEFEIDASLLTGLAGLAGMTIPPEDVDGLLVVLRNQLGLAEQLRSLDLADVPPITSMDARWL
jgi:Asp-tRNA(Asn)/Glu-tRNA(Gln) amidotransferase C subunit